MVVSGKVMSGLARLHPQSHGPEATPRPKPDPEPFILGGSWVVIRGFNTSPSVSYKSYK